MLGGGTDDDTKQQTIQKEAKRIMGRSEQGK
jgi:hypothetical protein